MVHISAWKLFGIVIGIILAIICATILLSQSDTDEHYICHYAIYNASGTSEYGEITGTLTIEETDCTKNEYTNVYIYDVHIITSSGDNLLLHTDTYKVTRHKGEPLDGTITGTAVIDTVYGPMETQIENEIQVYQDKVVNSVKYLDMNTNLTYRMTQDDGTFDITYDLLETNIEH